MNTGSDAEYFLNRRRFRRLLATALCISIAAQVIRLMVAYQALAFGADVFDLGVIGGAYALLSLLFAVPIGHGIDRWGPEKFAAVGVSAIVAVSLSAIWLNSIWQLAAALAVLGLGLTAATIANQTLTARLVDGSSSDARYGQFSAFVSLGQLIGPALGGFVAGLANRTPDITTALIVSSAIGGFGVVLAISLIPRPRRYRSVVGAEPHTHTRGKQATSQVLGLPGIPRAMFVSMTVLGTIDVLSVYLPALGEARGLSVETIGLLLSVRGGATFASRLGMMHLLRLAGRRHLLTLSVVVPGLALAVFPFIDAVWLMIALMVFVGFGLGLGQPITLAWVAGRTPPHLRGTALSIRVTCNRFAQVALPAAVAVIAGGGGVISPFMCMAAALAGGGAVAAGAPIDELPKD